VIDVISNNLPLFNQQYFVFQVLKYIVEFISEDPETDIFTFL